MKNFKRNIAVVLALVIAISMAVMTGIPAVAEDNVVVSWTEGEDNLWVSQPVDADDPNAIVDIKDGDISVDWGTREARVYEVQAKTLTAPISADALGLRFDMTVNASKIESAGNPPTKFNLVVHLFTAPDDPEAQPEVVYVAEQTIKLGQEKDVIVEFKDFVTNDGNKTPMDVTKVPEFTNIKVETNTWGIYFGVAVTNVKFDISKITSFDKVPETTADPALTTLPADMDAVQKVLDLYTEIPEDLTAEFTLDQYLALEAFLEAYTTLNDASAQYLADQYQITSAVYAELINLYNDMDIPSEGGDEGDDDDDNQVVTTTVSEPDEPNVSTGTSFPYGILALAAVAGVVLVKSKRK
ncbi:MAG: hypothetical protein IJF54_03385 [Clostridia bacterium]|nr:hypothetical protein [Clostridia bacterium]